MWKAVLDITWMSTEAMRRCGMPGTNAPDFGIRSEVEIMSKSTRTAAATSGASAL
jgi:hypothetical protein